MSSIFKAYDVRGIYPTDVNSQVAELVGRAAVFYLKSKLGINNPKFLVGRDGRNSSPELADALITSLTQSGAGADYMDITTTDAFYWTIGVKNYKAGIMVTASHNPSQYNGFKIVKEGVVLVSGKELEEIIDSSEFKLWNPMATKNGVSKISPFDEFVEDVVRQGDVARLGRRFKIVADPGNGTANVILPKISPKLPAEFHMINTEINGNFPGRGPDPMVNNTALCKKVVEKGADFGAAWDNDSDRILFVDETGSPASGDIILALVSKFMLEKHPGAAIVRDAICSKSVDEAVIGSNGKPVRSRVGHIFIKRAMKENNSPFGGEVSGHYYYQFPNDWFAESTWLTMIIVMQILDKTGKKLSEVLSDLTTYHKSKVITFELGGKNAEEILERLKQKYPDGNQDTLDGLTVDYEDWWFNARPSNTEPILKLVVEAKSFEVLSKKLEEVSELINSEL